METLPTKFIKKEKNKETIFTADEVIKKRFLGEGANGRIYEVEIKKGDHVRRSALKDYNDKFRAHRAYENYLNCKEAGVKVFQTMRISEDEKQLLMTLGTDDELTLIGFGSAIEWKKVEKIDNLQSLLYATEENILTATEKKIQLTVDSYFFLINNAWPNDVDFIIGDYDQTFRNQGSLPRTLFSANVENLQDALNLFFRRYITEDKTTENYMELVKDRLGNFKKTHSKRFNLF